MSKAKVQRRSLSAARNPLAAPRVTFKATQPSMTEQHHARACDINTIMAKFVKTGVLEHVSKYQPTYGDVTKTDFQEAMFLVTAVESEFAELPAFVRDHYGNDAQKYLESIQTPEGVEELRGLKPPGQHYAKDGSVQVPENQAPKAPEAAPDAQNAQKEASTEG